MFDIMEIVRNKGHPSPVPSKENNMFVLFLDIDGVLNSPWSNADHLFDVHGDKALKIIREDPGLVDQINPRDWFGSIFRPHEVHIHFLNKIIEETNALVVISSDWRRRHSFEEMVANFEKLGIIGRIIGMTDTISGIRGKQIQRFMDELNLKPDDILILDDCEDMGHLEHRLVKTDECEGLCQKDTERALNLFKMR